MVESDLPIEINPLILPKGGSQPGNSTTASSPTSNENREFPVTLPGKTLQWAGVTVCGPETKVRPLKERVMNDKPKKVKQILHNISGVARSGRLLAIMGSSGAGKTTLLNVLTQRNLSNLDVQGEVMMDGARVNRWKLREISAFVQQHDMFIGTLTVREHLQFMALLRMGSDFTKFERHARVDEVMQKMGLTKCADTMIGVPHLVKGLSCGEQKRLAFASEILTCPSIMFCDEPTSGLDAFMAGHVVQALRLLADSGMTVIITIHQPSSQTYSLFHDVCLMACGRVVYLGEGDKAVELFNECGFPCPPFYNAADHLIRTIAVTADRERQACLRKVAKIRDVFMKSEQGQQLAALTAKAESEKRDSDLFNFSESGWSTMSQKYKTSFFMQFIALFWRAWLTVTRDPILFKVRIGQTIVTAVITGMVYWQTPVNKWTVMTINGILFNHIRNINFMLQFPAVPAITSELPIVLRENANGVYRTSAYFFAKNLAEFPQYCLMPAIYITMVYWMSGLEPFVTSFLFAILSAILVTNVAISISYATATVFADTAIAMTFLPIFVVPIMAFGGFFINYDDIPWYFQWLSALSYFKYGYEALAVNEWDTIDFIPGCTNTTSLSHLSSCPQNGQEVLSQISFKSSNRWWDLFVLLMMVVVLRLIAFGALLVRTIRNK